MNKSAVRLSVSVCLVGCFASACGDDEEEVAPQPNDAAADMAADAAKDAMGLDAGKDVVADMSPDIAADVAADLSGDSPADAAADVAFVPVSSCYQLMGCNPVSQEGCQGGLSCSFGISMAECSTLIENRHSGESCTVGGYQCAAGLACVQGTCRILCCAGDDAVCRDPALGGQPGDHCGSLYMMGLSACAGQ